MDKGKILEGFLYKRVFDVRSAHGGAEAIELLRNRVLEKPE